MVPTLYLLFSRRCRIQHPISNVVHLKKIQTCKKICIAKESQSKQHPPTTQTIQKQTMGGTAFDVVHQMALKDIAKMIREDLNILSEEDSVVRKGFVVLHSTFCRVCSLAYVTRSIVSR